MNIVAESTVISLRQLGTPRCPLYEKALTDACNQHAPPFGMAEYGNVFREAAKDPAWLAESLIANAGAEGDGANRLWDLSASTIDSDVANQVRRHSVDESRHARWYVAILDLVFPEAVDPALRPHVDALSPGFSSSTKKPARERSHFAHEVTLDDLIQMNIAEIRTRIHHLLQRPMLLAHCHPDKRARLVQILDRLLHDETKHIAYTAELIEQRARQNSGEAMQSLMHRRVCDFNEITHRELSAGVFPSCAQCAKCIRPL